MDQPSTLQTYIGQTKTSCDEEKKNDMISKTTIALTKRKGLPYVVDRERLTSYFEDPDEFKILTIENFNEGGTTSGVQRRAIVFENLSQGSPKKTFKDAKIKMWKPKSCQTRKSSINSVEKYITVKERYVDPSLLIFNTILNTSIIDNDQKVFVLGKNNLDFYGGSPIGLLVCMFMVYHFNFDSKSKQNHSPKTIRLAKSMLHTRDDESLSSLNLNVGLAELRKVCFDSYFKYHHPFMPIVNKRSMLTSPNSHSSFLINIVCSLGSSYLPNLPPIIRNHFSDLAMKQFDNSYLKVSLDSISGLLLMANFQHNPKDCNKGYLALCHAIRMGYMIGLDQSTPRKSNTEVHELRNRLWWWCHILDKLYIFGMNRPCFHDFQLSERPSPNLSSMDFLNKPNQEDVLVATCACLFTKCFGELAKWMYSVTTRYKFLQVVDKVYITNTKKMVKINIYNLNTWKHKMCIQFDGIASKFGDWAAVRVNDFKLMMRLIVDSSQVQLLQTFTNYKYTDDSINFLQTKAIEASDNAIEAACQLGSRFNYVSFSYKYHALCAAAFYQIKDIRSQDLLVRNKAIWNLKRVLKIFWDSRLNFIMSIECYNMLKLVLSNEGLDKEFGLD